MLNFIKRLSSELDTVIDQSKLDKNYSKKKTILLSCYHQLLKCLDVKFANKLTFESGRLGQLALSLSMKQLDSKLLESMNINEGDEEGTLNTLNACNIIDNVMFMIPLSVVCEGPTCSRIPEALNYANVINSTEYATSLGIAMYEKYNKKPYKPEMVKKYSAYMNAYNIAKKSLAKYI